MQDTDKYVRSGDVVTRVIGGELLIVPVRGKVGDLASIYSLNGIGATIWEALANPVSVKDLTGMIASQYEVTSDQAHSDLELFLAEMTTAGLVGTVSAPE